MKPFATIALCAAGLAAAPIAARAADYLLVDAATGRPVAVVSPSPLPGIDALFAEQDAIMRHIFAEMGAIGASAMSPAAFGPAQMAPMAPGSTVITTSFSDGANSCSRTVVYEQNGSGAPIANVSQTGDACAALPALRGNAPVPAALPDTQPGPQLLTPAVNPNSPKLLRVVYRHPMRRPQPTRG